MDILWESSKVAEAVKGVVSHNFPIYGISIDTRNLKKGDMFVAIKGINNNGHAYIDDAFKKGASLAIVNKIKNLNKKNKQIKVSNTLEFLTKSKVWFI